MSAVSTLKALVRDTCGQALSMTRVTAPSVRLGQRLSVVTFHRVLTEPQRRLYPLPGLAVTPDELDDHLRFLTRHFQCLSLDAALGLWERGQGAGRPLLAITFDDGQLDNYENALPVLEKNGVTASFYVPSQVLEDATPLWHDTMAVSVAWLVKHSTGQGNRSGSTERDAAIALFAELHPEGELGGAAGHLTVEAALEHTKRWNPAQREDWMRRASGVLPPAQRPAWDGFMSVEQMKDLVARGHEIGSHSHSHALLPQCTDDELRAEIAGSRQRLEAVLGTPVTTFCYPNGSFDSRCVAQAREAGYRAAVTTLWGSNVPGADPFRLQRFNMNAQHAQDRNGRFSEARLAWRMSGLHPGLGRVTQDPCGGDVA
ncbi:polysaccharide deacetylase family protein [Hydrogenophaga flava]|uniref:polysaccharide deacetylase family protein n=1 Tax=Hydrogenophaga flava TaxID=65657 RepID=UPI00082478A3|nr:polysaccharide deacetylase family protein [Hydrogenophaga flava]